MQTQARDASEWKRTALVLVTWVVSVSAFVPVYHRVGEIATLLTIPPVMVTGWFFGMWTGVLAGSFAFLLNAWLVELIGGSAWRVLTQMGLSGNVLIVLVGAIVGRLHDLGSGMKQQSIDRKQVEETLSRRRHELDMLNRASQVLSATLDLDQVLAIILEDVRHQMQVVACSVWLVDPMTDELVCQQATGSQSDIVRGWRLEPGRGISGWVASHGESVIVADALADQRHVRSVGERTGLTTRSILSVPLKTKQGVIGVLQVMDEIADRFGLSDQMLLEPLAASAAIAIENARLVNALRQRSADLEARNEELTGFTYVASHNLRAPLVNIQGFASELRHILETIEPVVRPVLAHLDEAQQQIVANAVQHDIPEALDFIDSSVASMTRFNRGLLELSWISRRKLTFEPVDMEDVFREALQAVADQIAGRQVEVTVGPLPTVTVDRAAMRLVAENLLDNAVRYLAPGRPGKVEITAESSSHETIFHVRDNGRGIAEEDISKVFTPFRRAGSLAVPGEGLGLAYVQALVRRHNGRIWCESQLDVGTTFTFAISNHSAKGNDNVREIWHTRDHDPSG
jgi:signal transduction histidine kinase